MVYILLNCALAVFFVGLTIYIDRWTKVQIAGDDPIIVNILLMAIISILFSVTLALQNVLPYAFFRLLVRLIFLLEGCFLVNISAGFIYYAWKRFPIGIRVAKILLYLVVGYFIFFRFDNIAISNTVGILVQSPYLFPGDLRHMIPWTWAVFYSIIFRFVLPGFCCLFMLLKNEMSGTRLERHQGHVRAAALLMMWCTYLFLSNISRIAPSLMLLFLYMYFVFIIIDLIASQQRSAASANDTILFFLKLVISYLLPAVCAGLLFTMTYHLAIYYPVLFYAIILVGFGFAIFFSVKMSEYLSKLKLLHSADYEESFQRDLASVDYNGEMDEIIGNMFKIFKKNVECSSMSIYISNGQGMLDTAYSSDNKVLSIPDSNPAFDLLLNINKTVVASIEIDSTHDLDPVKKELNALFEQTNSDAMFLLNEGRNLLGIITLGLKTSGEHYREYDIAVFNRLYSYFFVFGFYMRNISNKEIIGTVNREIRMSSQIITSIQENTDPIKSSKIDAGCVMIPAHNIGGEFIDLIRLNDHSHLFVIGDLSGKGIAASMSMVILKSIIRTFLAETHDFKQLAVRVNSFVRFSLPKGTIFSGLFALVDYRNDVMYYINCGCPGLFLYTQAYNNVIEIQGGGHVLGFVSDITSYLSVKQIQLHKGDVVLSCTDGLINSHSLRGERFGKDHVQQVMLANIMYPAQRMAQFEYDSLMRFMSKEMEDDVSVLVIKYQDVAAVTEPAPADRAAAESSAAAEPDAALTVQAQKEQN